MPWFKASKKYGQSYLWSTFAPRSSTVNIKIEMQTLGAKYIYDNKTEKVVWFVRYGFIESDKSSLETKLRYYES